MTTLVPTALYAPLTGLDWNELTAVTAAPAA